MMVLKKAFSFNHGHDLFGAQSLVVKGYNLYTLTSLDESTRLYLPVIKWPFT